MGPGPIFYCSLSTGSQVENVLILAKMGPVAFSLSLAWRRLYGKKTVRKAERALRGA